jgi:hypothetical protein
MRHVLIILFSTLTISAVSQEDSVKTKKVDFGLSIGFNHGLLRVTDVGETGFEYDVGVENTFGFGAGLTFIYHINDRLHLKPYLNLLLNSSAITYDLSGVKSSKWIYASSTETTVLGEYDLKSGKSTPTILLGASMVNLIRGVGDDIPELNSLDFTIKAGFGFKQERELITWDIDLLFSLGLNNLIADGEDYHNQLVQSAYKDMVTVVFHFY